jgi:uncharacterized phage-associated protein
MDTPSRRPPSGRGDAYPGSVTVSAHDVARVLRQQLPGLGDKKLHKLLYLCQGHHVAALGRRLFNEEIHAYDMGPVVARLWKDEKVGRTVPPVDLDEAALNTVAFVISRYGALPGRDLEILSHHQDPWTDADQARSQGGSDIISESALAHFFSSSPRDEENDPPWPDEEVIAECLRGTPQEPPVVHAYDDVERLRERARGW